MDKKLKILTQLSLFGAILTFLVIGLGAYTRLIDAGLGCPDWPGCYGHFLIPTTKHAIEGANLLYPEFPVVAHKAWAEMIHRYFAGALGIWIIIIALTCVLVAVEQGIKFLVFGMSLFALTIYQALLGMWTVTLKLMPLVVLLHLLGAMSIIALLVLLFLTSKNYHYPKIHNTAIKKYKPWVLLGLMLIYIQIVLGAWTSANYAALICPNFPQCHINLTWHYEFREAYNFFSPVGINYEGGILRGAARMTIQMVHRFGALVVSIYLLSLIFLMNLKVKFNSSYRNLSLIIVFLLILQGFLGILNVKLQLPLLIAIAHNLCAVLLLLAIVILNYRVFAQHETHQKIKG